MNRQTLCIDFDGVIHAHGRGWRTGEISGEVTDGFFDWVNKVRKHFDLAVFSTRSRTPGGRAQMKRWLQSQWRKAGHRNHMPDFRFVAHKPPTWLTIDDRCVCFQGDWGELTVERIQSFRPWYARDHHESSVLAVCADGPECTAGQ